MGLFSFLTGKKEDGRPSVERPPRPAADAVDSGHEGAVAEAGVELRPADVVAPPGPPDIPSDIGYDPPHAGTPFQPPEAWNVDALTAPRPEPIGDKPEIGPVDPVRTAELQPKIVEALKTVYDPEIPVDIYELGLVYGIDVDAEKRVLVSMTLTSPACPSAQQLPSEVRYKVKAIPGVQDAWVEIVWEPPWDKDRMSEAARLQLGFY